MEVRCLADTVVERNSEALLLLWDLRSDQGLAVFDLQELIRYL